MMFEIQDLTPDRDLRVAIVAARFNRFIVDELLAGARDALVRHAVEPDGCALVWVPGAFELPVMAERLASSGEFDAIVALVDDDVILRSELDLAITGIVDEVDIETGPRRRMPTAQWHRLGDGS